MKCLFVKLLLDYDVDSTHRNFSKRVEEVAFFCYQIWHNSSHKIKNINHEIYLGKIRKLI